MTRGRKFACVLGMGLIVCAGLVAARLWLLGFGVCTALPRRLVHQVVFHDTDFIAPDTRFKLMMMGTGRTPDGYVTDFSKFRASDCVEVVHETVELDSPANAEKELEKSVREASLIIEGPMQEASEKRAVLRTGPHATQIVGWYPGKRWISITESKSTAHARALEKLLRARYKLDSDSYVVPTSP